MKISELISELNDFKKENGDLDIYISARYGEFEAMEPDSLKKTFHWKSDVCEIVTDIMTG